MFVSINPTTGREVRRVAENDPSRVSEILTAAANAQIAWRRTPIAKRTPVLRSIAQRLRHGQDRFAALITEEMGKPISEARAEIAKCAMTCEFYAEQASRFLADQPTASNATESAVVYEPLGVILSVMPWNFPFWQFIRFAAPALAAGNGAILKHAANVPGCALEIEALFIGCGCPDGLVRTVFIDSGRVGALIADDRIAGVAFTGSTQVGALIGAAAGKAIKKQVLELGGSDPFIVLADADIGAAAACAVRSRFVNGGQSCVNAKRIIVEDAIADEFVDAFVHRVAALRLGDPSRETTELGPLARPDLRTRIHDQVTRSLAEGAKLAHGGKPVESEGFFYEPTVLDHVRPHMTAFKEETFGPLAAIVRADDDAHAVTLANQTEFGLGATIWSKGIERAKSIARELDAGAVFINGMMASDPRLPFGGVKRSGYGRELGEAGIKEFVNTKTIWIGPAVA